MLKHSSYFKERPDFAVKIYDAQTAYYVIRNISSFFSSFPKATWSSQKKATIRGRHFSYSSNTVEWH